MTLAITLCSSFLGCPYRFCDIWCLFDLSHRWYWRWHIGFKLYVRKSVDAFRFIVLYCIVVYFFLFSITCWWNKVAQRSCGMAGCCRRPMLLEGLKTSPMGGRNVVLAVNGGAGDWSTWAGRWCGSGRWPAELLLRCMSVAITPLLPVGGTSRVSVCLSDRQACLHVVLLS